MLKYTRFPDCDFTLFVVEPETPITEWLSTLISYQESGETKYELYDTHKIKIIPKESDLEDIINHHHVNSSKRPAGSKTAIVVRNLKEHFLVRMYSILAKTVGGGKWHTCALFSIEEAKAWLGIERPPLPDMCPGQRD